MVPSAVEHASQPSKGNSLPQTATRTSPGTGLLPSVPQEAGHLSGTCCEVLAYQHGLQSLSATHGDQTLESNTIRSCEGGERVLCLETNTSLCSHSK